MAADLGYLRRKQSVDTFARGIATLIVLGFIAYVVLKGFILP